MFYITEIITQPFDRGSSDFRLNPAKGNAESLRLRQKGMTAERCANTTANRLHKPEGKLYLKKTTTTKQQAVFL